ncbi:hypothetical protein Q8F55_002624 [Vanrija albida]|uniref:N-acetyltransferase domain-containing protein n=1 Tax=Vanrija albida TaxID=181172 RepID=A0ABR3QAB0_9TREE
MTTAPPAPAPGVRVRRATASDAAAIAAVGARSFARTYAGSVTDADMDAYVARYFSAGQIASELAEGSVFHVAAAEEDGAEVVVAFSALRAGPSEECVAHIPARERIEIHRVHADARYHGLGVGRLLMEATLARARELGARLVWLSVWESNERAKSFYTKFGFGRIGSHDFYLGDEPRTDWVMGKEL